MEHIIQVPAQFIEDSDWIRFPGGVLAGKCPKTTCPTCRAAVGRASEPRAGATLCFQCYRAEIDRDRALKAAGQLDTASTRRFQTALPFEPVNRPRLEMLKVDEKTGFSKLGEIVHGDEVLRSLQIDDFVYSIGQSEVKVVSFSDPTTIVADVKLTSNNSSGGDGGVTTVDGKGPNQPVFLD